MNLNEIKKLIRIFEKSEIGELEIVEDNHKIRMSRGAQSPQNTPNANGSGTTYILPSNQTIPGQNNVEQPQISGETPSTQPKGSEPGDTYHEVRAPMVGTFYRSPNPDEESYVETGDAIATGQTLCIIEAMKLMNEIQSEVDGKIAKVLVENAQPVEYNQVLFLVEPK